MNNRKGKLIFFYEWDLILKWKGHLVKPESTVYAGKISIPNLSEENELDDIEITITIDKSNDESEKLKEFMYNIGRIKIRNMLGVYVTQLKEEYSKNLILPKKEDNVPNMHCNAPNISPGLHESRKTSHSESSLGCKLDVLTLLIEEEFHCSANDLYNALTKQSMVTAFTRAPAKVDPVRGGE